jgi:hypothetical protein
VRKDLLEIPASIQHADDLSDIVVHAVEDDMRARYNRPQAWADLIAAATAKGMVIKHGARVTNTAHDSVSCMPTGNLDVIVPDFRKVGAGLGRPDDGRLPSAMPLVLVLQELFDVQRSTLASVERADALVDLGPELAELLDVRQQSAADLFLVGIRQIRQFSDC